MDTQTGQIHQLPPNQTIDEFVAEIAKTDHLHRTPEEIKRDMVLLAKQPEPACPKCKGKGYLRRGLNSRRFKPCPCCAK